MKLLSLSAFITVACLACTPPASRVDAGPSSTPDGGSSTNEPDAGPSTNAPDAGPSTYPQAPTVSVDELARALPKDAEGRPILTTVDGTELSIGQKRVDAIGAAAACRDLTASCVMATRDIDGCIASVVRCATNEPWLETRPCCASACVEAFNEQRQLGAPSLAADAAVFGSTHECFPGLQERLRAIGGTPRLMPRRTP